MAGTEPSDGLRVCVPPISIQSIFRITQTFICKKVVNALLTQLDKLKHKKNVLVMSTSNLAKAIGNLLVLFLAEELRYSATSE